MKTIINNVCATQFYLYPNMAADTKFQKLGRFNLRDNCYHAAIAVNRCYRLYLCKMAYIVMHVVVHKACNAPTLSRLHQGYEGPVVVNRSVLLGH